MNLKYFLEKFFLLLMEDYPIHYKLIARLAGNRKIRIIDDTESIIFIFKDNIFFIVEDKSKEKLPLGIFKRNSLLNIIDGNSNLNEMIKKGNVDCIGKISEILLFHRILEIIIFVSARSPFAHALWKKYEGSS
jgi:hypothetical protein